MNETEQYAKSQGLTLKEVSIIEFRDLATSPAFPFDNPRVTFLVGPAYSEKDDVTCARDIHKRTLYWCRGNVWQTKALKEVKDGTEIHKEN
jgi:hypothetical protein